MSNRPGEPGNTAGLEADAVSTLSRMSELEALWSVPDETRYANRRREEATARARRYRVRHKREVRAYQRQYRALHRDDINARVRARRAALGPAERSAAWRKQRVGITQEEFDALLASQNGICAGGCGRPATDLDHDHACCPGRRSCGKCVRGILCTTCNLLDVLGRNSLTDADLAPEEREQLEALVWAGYRRWARRRELAAMKAAAREARP